MVRRITVSTRVSASSPTGTDGGSSTTCATRLLEPRRSRTSSINCRVTVRTPRTAHCRPGKNSPSDYTTSTCRRWRTTGSSNSNTGAEQSGTAPTNGSRRSSTRSPRKCRCRTPDCPVLTPRQRTSAVPIGGSTRPTPTLRRFSRMEGDHSVRDCSDWRRGPYGEFGHGEWPNGHATVR